MPRLRSIPCRGQGVRAQMAKQFELLGRHRAQRRAKRERQSQSRRRNGSSKQESDDGSSDDSRCSFDVSPAKKPVNNFARVTNRYNAEPVDPFDDFNDVEDFVVDDDVVEYSDPGPPSSDDEPNMVKKKPARKAGTSLSRGRDHKELEAENKGVVLRKKPEVVEDFVEKTRKPRRKIIDSDDAEDESDDDEAETDSDAPEAAEESDVEVLGCYMGDGLSSSSGEEENDHGQENDEEEEPATRHNRLQAKKERKVASKFGKLLKSRAKKRLGSNASNRPSSSASGASSVAPADRKPVTPDSDQEVDSQPCTSSSSRLTQPPHGTDAQSGVSDMHRRPSAQPPGARATASLGASDARRASRELTPESEGFDV